jgi:hypothetical protein
MCTNSPQEVRISLRNISGGSYPLATVVLKVKDLFVNISPAVQAKNVLASGHAVICVPVNGTELCRETRREI